MRRRGHRLLEHTADMGIEAWGASSAECLEEAAAGLVEILAGPEILKVVGEGEAREIEIEGVDRADLLVAWLSRLLYLFDAEGLVPVGFRVHEAGETSLAATARLLPFDSERCFPLALPKAITYHRTEFIEEKGGWRGRVYLDV